MPTRLPNGLSFILPHSEARSGAYTFAAGDTTPSVKDGSVFFVNGHSSVTITDFDSAEKGQVFLLYSHSANFTTLSTGGNIKLAPVLSANTDTGSITASAASSLTLRSNQIASFLCIDNAGNCAQIDELIS